LKTLIVSHDAGGAEILSSWVRENGGGDYRFVLNGPAAEIFTGKLANIKIEPADRLKELMGGSDLVVTGTSWSSDLEKEAIVLARSTGIKSASFIDHWVNYPERFKYNGATVLPDEIWVGDEYAFDLAGKYFPGHPLKLVPNPYFKSIRNDLNKIGVEKDRGRGIRMLYVCEPISEHALKEYGDERHYGYTEFEAIENLFGNLPMLFSSNEITDIRLRMHPAEIKDKYNGLLTGLNDSRVALSMGSSLLQDCVWADWVMGCESMGLVIGLLAGKKVFSVIPQGGQACSLPQKEIVHLFKEAE
jgi:hypothetical protein